MQYAVLILVLLLLFWGNTLRPGGQKQVCRTVNDSAVHLKISYFSALSLALCSLHFLPNSCSLFKTENAINPCKMSSRLPAIFKSAERKILWYCIWKILFFPNVNHFFLM